VATFETLAQQEISRIVRDLNDAWVEGRPEDLDRFFHEHMVIVAPGLQERLEGREDCMGSYRDFCSRATMRGFRIMDPAIDVFGETAIATYSYEISYELDGEGFDETGRDVFVFVLKAVVGGRSGERSFPARYEPRRAPMLGQAPSLATCA
jgi:ketosteroid isomerase-like protein